MPLVSIIVPVYKAEKWLHRCVDSILAQTMTDFELLLIDDGSPDKSGEICDEYAAKDDRVRVFHKENGGVSSARQMGLENATGEYVIHCDPDDWVESNMLLELTQYAKDTQSDMVICDYYSENIYGEELTYHKQDLQYKETSYSVLNKLINQKIHGACWNKLLRRNCLHGIGFYPTDVFFAEDELFNVKILKPDLRVSYLNKAYYHYVQHSKAITAAKDVNSLLLRVKEIEELEKVLDKKEFNNFVVIKNNILFRLFITNNLKNVYGLFSEVYPQIIEERKNYNPKLPIQYFYAVALRGYPRLAYYLCNLNVFVILFLQKLKNLFV